MITQKFENGSVKHQRLIASVSRALKHQMTLEVEIQTRKLLVSKTQIDISKKHLQISTES